MIFPIVHGTLGEDGSLQGMLRLANLPFVGSDVLGSALCMDKAMTKRVLQAAGLAVAPFESIPAPPPRAPATPSWPPVSARCCSSSRPTWDPPWA